MADPSPVLSEIASTYELGTGIELQSIMEMSNAIISGSWALYALFPGAFQPADLDIYISGAFPNQVHFLTSLLYDHGYQVTAYGDTTYLDIMLDDTIINIILKYSKPSLPTSKSINIIITHASPLQAIFHFHSTVVMNYIASYGLVCLYPTLTLHRRGLINHREVPLPVIHCIDKYRDRGFDLQFNLRLWADTRVHLCGISPVCPITSRHLYDNSVYFIPFEGGEELDTFVEDQRWKLRIDCEV